MCARTAHTNSYSLPSAMATPGHGIDATRVAPNSSDLFLVRSTPPARARMGLYLTAPPVALCSQGRDSRHPVRTLPPPDGPKLEVAISLNQLHQVEGVYTRGTRRVEWEKQHQQVASIGKTVPVGIERVVWMTGPLSPSPSKIHHLHLTFGR